MLNVHTGKLQQTLTLCKQTNAQIQTLPYYFCHQQLNNKSNQLMQDMQRLQSFLQSSQQAYEQAEGDISNNANKVLGTVIQKPQVLSSSKSKDPFWKADQSSWNTSHRFHTSISPSKSFDDYVKNGVCFGAYGSASILEYTLSKDMKYASMKNTLSFGKAEASGDLHIQIFDENKKINPEFSFEAEGSVCLAEASSVLNVGSKNVYLEAGLKGQAGVAYGECKSVINKEEVTIKGKVGMAALRGETEWSVNFFGKKITFTGSGEVGALGAGAEFSSKTGEVEFGGNVSFLAGLGFKVKIEF